MNQYYEIAKLIFIARDNVEEDIVTQEEAQTVQNRFQNILESFVGVTDHETKVQEKKNENELPFSSKTKYGGVRYGSVGDILVLHFADSYRNPVMFMWNRDKAIVTNYLDMKSAKAILRENVYQTVYNELHEGKYLNNLLQGIPDIDKFIEAYVDELERHHNEDQPTGYDCFELDPRDL